MPLAATRSTPEQGRHVTVGKANWNVVVTALEDSFRDAYRLLQRWGSVRRTPYFNVLVMAVEDPIHLLRDFAAAVAENPGYLNFVSHLFPAQRTIDFADAGDFEVRAREVVVGWLPDLAGKTFHVRLHRRGLKGILSTPKEERFLDDALLEGLKAAEIPSRIGFDAPDAVIQIETIDGRAGLSLWTAHDLRRYPFLGVGWRDSDAIERRGALELPTCLWFLFRFRLDLAQEPLAWASIDWRPQLGPMEVPHMVASRKRSARARRRQERPARSVVVTRESGTEPGPAAQEAAEPFDEPATPMPEPVVPIEQPAPLAPVPEDCDTCGLPDEAMTRASDLH